MGAPLLNGRLNWRKDANWGKEKKGKIRKKVTNGKWGKKRKGKRKGREGRKERRRGQNILKKNIE